MALLVVVLAAASAMSLIPASLAVTSPYVRPPPRPTLSLLQVPDDTDGQMPQQVRFNFAFQQLQATSES